jgi:hypothetical protein
LLTSSRSAGIMKQRRRRRGSTGRRWRTPAAQENTPVSMDQAWQGGRGHTEGCPEQLTARRSSLWHWTGHERNDDHRTGGGHRRAVAELSVCGGRARERGEGAGQRAQMREGRWASRVRGSKGARGLGRGWGTRGRGRVHGEEIVGERLETTDRWGRQDRERGSGRARGKQRRQLGPTVQRERERGK